MNSHSLPAARKPTALRDFGVITRRLFTGALLASLVLLAGCPMPEPPPPPATMVALQLVAGDLTSPVDVALPGDGSGRRFIVDQVGHVRILDAAGNLIAAPFLDIADRMVSVGIDFGGGFIFDERGLLGLAFHPDFAANRRFFVFYNTPLRPGDPATFDSRIRISEFLVLAADPNRADPASERVLLEVLKPQFNHNGGQIAFGPDGFLYIAIGDGGGGNDVGEGHTVGLGNGQDASTLLGKILRIDVDGGDPYGVPPGNPFVADSSFRPEIWAYGLRNPFRFSFDSGGSRRLFVGDAGQELFEEVDIVTPGGNYGWFIREGANCFDPNSPFTAPAACATTGARGEPLIEPIIEYPHQQNGVPLGIVVIGGFVYRGNAIPGLHGDYVFGDFSTSFLLADGTLFAARENTDGTWERRELAVAGSANGRINRFILAFGRDDDGELFVLTSENLAPLGKTGQVWKLTPAP